MSVPAYAQAVAAFRHNRIGVAQARLREAIVQEPGDPHARHLAGVVALASGNLEEAEARFREALRLFPASDHDSAAAAWVGLGRAQLPRGNLERALSCFDRAARLCPGFGPARAGRAAVWCDLGDYALAESEARAALDCGDDARTRLVLARSLLFQSRVEEAEPILGMLARDPDVRFAARFHLAGCRAARGHAREAQQIFRALLQERPGYPGHLELARTKTFVEEDDADLQRMAAVLDALPAAPAHLSDVLRTDLCFALAKAYDDLGEAARAWPFLAEANRLKAAAEPFDFAAFRRRADRIVAAGRSLAEGAAQAEHPGRRAAPLVIAALPRSGSSLLEQMLARHPAVTAGGEFSPFIPPLDDLLERSGDGRPASSAIAAARRRIDAALEDRGSRVRRVTEKSPVAFLYAGLLGALCPDARVVHLTRHPMDVALGQYSQAFARGLGWTYDLESIARYHAAYERVMSAWRQSLGDRLLEIRYEALVQRPERELARILAFCGLDYDPACLDFRSSRRPVWTASGLQVRERLNARRVGRWRRYGEHLDPLASRLRESMVRYEARLAEEGVPY